MLSKLLCKSLCIHPRKDDSDSVVIKDENQPVEKYKTKLPDNDDDNRLANGKVAISENKKKVVSNGNTIKLMEKEDWYSLKRNTNKNKIVGNNVKNEVESKVDKDKEADDVATISVKVEVHSSSSGAGSGSDENLSSSDLSERSGDAEPDPDPEPEPEYEDIYLLREEAAHSTPPSHDQPSMTASTESGVSSASPSDLGHSEEEGDKLKVSHRHSLPHPANNSRALKRVVSEPGSTGPPPPPPPPPAELESQDLSAPPSRRASSGGEDATPLQAPPSPVVNPEPVVKPSEVLRALGARKQSLDSTINTHTSGASEAEQDGSTRTGGGPNLVNKQMVLPFVPPKFPNNVTDSNSLIKPSEYLRSLGGIKTPSPVFNTPTSTTGAVVSKPDQCSEDSASETGVKVQQQSAAAAAPSIPAPPAPVGPPPPPLPTNAATLPSPTTHQTFAEAERTKQQLQQPLGAISIQDLNSVQLRRTDKMLAAKTLSAPPRAATLLHNGDTPFQAQKEDLIAELKMARDVPGVKKLKVERAKEEEKQEKEMFTEITRSLTTNSFVEKIPDKDATGNPIPEWKRQMLAKKAAERARKELEQQLVREAEEKRLQSIPAWKRQLLAKKEETDTKNVDCRAGVYTPRVVEDKRPAKALLSKDECWHQQQPAAVPEPAPEPTPAPAEDTSNKENKTPLQQTEDDSAQIMPWRAQLRKTNSKLSLMD